MDDLLSCVTVIFSVPSRESGSGSCYFRLPLYDRYHWSDANHRCAALGNDSYIAVANDCNELLELSRLMLFNSYNGSRCFWLGFVEESDEDIGILSCPENVQSYWRK